MLDPSRFGFAPDFPLDANLEHLRGLYARDRALEWSTPAQRRKAAERLAKLTQDWLSAASAVTRSGGGYLVDEGNPEGLAARMIQCRDETKAAVAKLKAAPAQRGELPHRAERILVYNLHRLYCEGTGEAHRYTYDPVADAYSGPFVEFALEVSAQFGASLTGQFIAHHLPKLKV